MACYHDDGDACDCRKPKPGALLDAAQRHGIDLERSFMVGDRWRDIEAGQRAGCRCLFVDHGYAERQPRRTFVRVPSLAAAAEWIHRAISDDDDSTDLTVKIFADGAEKAGMLEMYAKPYIKGFTTNPTLMRKAGLTDYRAFAREIVAAIPDRPISFEVFSDEFDEMERQAREIATWGENVYVKIPVTNTRREPAYDLVRRLSHEGVKLNVTAIMTSSRCATSSTRSKDGAPSCVSVFAGRIADTGRDPVPLMTECARHPEGRADGGADLGQPARAAEHLPGRRHRLPHHHRHERHPQEAVADRQGPRRLLARHGQDVLRRRPEGWVHALIFVTGAAGFIGFHVSKRLLERGDDVVGIDNLNDYYDPALKHARLEHSAQVRAASNSSAPTSPTAPRWTSCSRDTSRSASSISPRRRACATRSRIRTRTPRATSPAS